MPENRLGMIVCGAFLGLVSAVVVAKMREPATEPDKAVAAETSPTKVDPAPTPAAPETAPETPLPMPHTESISLPEPNVPAPPHPAEVHPKGLELEPPHEPPASRVALNELPTPPGGFTRVGATEPLPAPVEHDAPPAPPAPPSAKLEPPPPPPPAPQVPDAPALPLPGVPEKKEKDDEDNSKAKNHSKDDKDIKQKERAKEEKDAALVPLPQINGANEPPPLPGPPSLPEPPERKENDPPKAPEKITPPPAPLAAPPEPMPLKVDPPLTAPEPPAPKPDKVTVVIPASPPPARVEPPPFVPSPVRNPIAASPPSGAPLVDSWDERTYTAKPGDTYAAISQSEYKTEDYAKALQMYNQNHPRAGDAMRRDGTMAPGDRIYLPPSPVLEKRHADVIVRSKPKPMTTGSAGGDGFGPVQAEFRAPADKPANPTYKVQGNGETLFQIAAQQLHDGNRWSEIAALNPRAPTDRNVLGGTILQMPAASASAAAPVPHP